MQRCECLACCRPIAGSQGTSGMEEIHGMFQDLSARVKEDKEVAARV